MTALPPPPPMLLEMLGPREHIKFLLPLSSQPLAPSETSRGDGKMTAEEAATEASAIFTDRMLVLLSNVSNADDAELSALLLIDTRKWATVTAIPVVPGLLGSESDDPHHILVTTANGSVQQPPSTSHSVLRAGEVSGRQVLLVEGWSPDTLLLQDLRLLLDLSNDSSEAPSAEHLILTRWTWLKRYCSEEQFAALKRLLREKRDAAQVPVWGNFAETSASAAKPVAVKDDDLCSVRVAVVTYNVGGATSPAAPEVLTFLSAQHEATSADILAIGLQEVDSSSSAYLWFDPSRQAAWLKVIKDALELASAQQHGVRWEFKAAKQHVTMLLLVYQRYSVPEESELSANNGATKRPDLSLKELSVASVGVGLGGFMANKGAVALRMRLQLGSSQSAHFESTLCLVTAHLSAGTGRIAMERRVWDWAEIEKRLLFRLASDSDDGTIPMDSDRHDDKSDRESESYVKLISMRQHDHVILFGDLNSRLPMSLSSHQVQRLLRRGKVGAKMLLGYDELKGSLMMANKSPEGIVGADDTSLLLLHSWRHWRESPIHFAPTYKFDVGTSTYDTSEKQRAPAWTDRVLLYTAKSVPGVGPSAQDNPAVESSARARGPHARFESYSSQPDMSLSDHKPVFAIVKIFPTPQLGSSKAQVIS